LGGDLTQNGIGFFPMPFFIARVFLPCLSRCVALIVLIVFLAFPLDVVHLHISWQNVHALLADEV
jgi:hypothetical protein